MKLLTPLFATLFALFFSASSFAATASASMPSESPGNLLRIIVSLILVVGILIVFSVVFKKFGMDRIHGNFPVKVVGGISIGSNQRIMIIEAGGEWVVLGVTPHNITPLTTMMPGDQSTENIADKPNFSKWIQGTMERYRAGKT